MKKEFKEARNQKPSIHCPFFVFNPKSYLTGPELFDFALEADHLAEQVPFSIIVTAPFADLSKLSSHTSHVLLFAQHMDGIPKGRGMGMVLPESLVEAGAKGVFLNHAERPLTMNALIQSVQRARELGLLSIVCANSIEEARAIATLHPNVILCEPTDRIGTGQTSEPEYIQNTNEAIKEISPDVLVMQAAGISNEEDVFRVIRMGADGTGCTSGIVKANHPKEMMAAMIAAVEKARREQAS